jgi:ribosomal protein S18 acetylase RimI-like enzyme
MPIKTVVTLRTVMEKDVEAIIAIDAKITGRPRPDFWRRKIASYWDGSLEDLGGRDPLACRVAEVEGRVVGFMMGDIRPWAFGLERSGWIEVLGVDPQYRRLGVGRLLAEALFRHFKKNGVSRVFTMVEAEEEDLLAYFQSLGFKQGSYVNLEMEIK